MGKKNILLFGLQRSGTNFLESLLLKNYRVKVCNDNISKDGKYAPSQKHFRLYDEKELVPEPQYTNELFCRSFNEYEQALGLKDDIHGIMVMSKDPYSWLLSYRNWAKKNDWPSVDYHYSQEYDRFYGKWFEFGEQSNKILFLKYQDFLNDPAGELQRVEEKFDLKLTLKRRLSGGRVLKLSRVGQSADFTKDKLNYYLNKEYLNSYDDDELKTINSVIDSKLFKNLGYEKVTVQS